MHRHERPSPMEVVGLVIAQIDDALQPRDRTTTRGAVSSPLLEARAALLLVGTAEDENVRLESFDRAMTILGASSDPISTSLRAVLERERPNLVTTLASFRKPAESPTSAQVSLALPAEFAPLLPEAREERGAKTPEAAQRDGLLRDALDDVGSLGLLRRTSPDEPWAQSADFERRLVAALDFLMSLRTRRRPDEPTLALSGVLAAYGTDWPIPHPGRYFAWAFVLSNVAGETARTELRSVILRANEDVADLLVDALALGSGESARNVVEDLLDDDARPWSLRIGLAASRRRRECTVDSAVPLLSHPSRDVAVEAALACAHLPLRDVEAPLVRALDRGGEIASAAARSLAQNGSPYASKWLRSQVEGGATHRDDLLTLALISTPADEPLLYAAATRLDDPSAASSATEALAWAGFTSALPLLYAKLVAATSTDERRRWARCLARVTGLGCERGSSDALSVEDPDGWRALLVGVDLPPQTRLRMGKPLERSTVLEALASDDTLSAHRALLLFELARLDRAQPTLDVDDWIVRQRHRLSHLAHSHATS